MIFVVVVAFSFYKFTSTYTPHYDRPATVQWSLAPAIQTTSNADLAIGSCSYYTASDSSSL